LGQLVYEIVMTDFEAKAYRMVEWTENQKAELMELEIGPPRQERRKR